MVFLKKLVNYIWSRNFLINIGLILLVYVIGTLVFNACLKSSTNHGQKLEVPNLIGKNQNNLDNIMANSQLGYEVLDSVYMPDKVEGTIIAQDPHPTKESGIYVKEGRVIKVSVTKRTQLVEVPNLVDRSQHFAEKILSNREFRYRLEYKPSQEADGAVIEQLYKGKPLEPGTKIPIGSRIELIIGRFGGEALTLPNLYGLTIVEAKERVSNMENMDFLAVCPSCITVADSLIARVESQSPEYTEGAIVTSGTTITVFAVKELNNIPE